MKFILIAVTLLSFNSFAQDSDSVEVRFVLDQLFEGMRTGDSTMVANTFHPDIQMVSIFNTKQGDIGYHMGSAQEFKNAVGTPHDDIWDERISNVVIQLDGNLAQVWMNYSFYLNDKFSHCGVNSIQMLRTKDGWKMIHLADTRRRSDCN